MCQEVRRNSPSVADCSPTSSCILTTSVMASSSAARSSSAVTRPAAKSSRAFSSAGGRRRLPTWSARNGGVSRTGIVLLRWRGLPLRYSSPPDPLWSEGERSGAALDRYPAELGELVSRGGGAEAAPAAVLDAAERHLRLVVHRLVVDVDDARLQRLRQGEPPVRIGGQDAGGQSVAGRVRPGHRRLGAVHHLDGGDGPERLQAAQVTVLGDVGDQRRLV